jgi:hypothetical protein
VIQEAVRAGRLGGFGGALTVTEATEAGIPFSLASKPLDKLRLCESADRKEMERRTGLDLGYTLTLPFPGRRNLPDVVSLVGTVVTVFDPSGVNVPLRRHLLNFLATHGMELEDPQGFVDEVLPDDMAPVMMPGLDQETGEPYPDPRNPDVAASNAETQAKISAKYGTGPGGAKMADGSGRGERPRGARTGSPPTREELALWATERALLGEALGEDVAQAWEAQFGPLLLTGNGHGGDGH